MSPLCVTRMQTHFFTKKNFFFLLSVLKIEFGSMFRFPFLLREKRSTRSVHRVDFGQLICVFISIFSVRLLKINLFSVNCQFLFFFRVFGMSFARGVARSANADTVETGTPMVGPSDHV